MSDRDNHRAQRDAMRAARDATVTETQRLQEDALARYLRLQSRRPPRRQKTAPPTTKESE